MSSPSSVLAELGGGAQRPVGIAQLLARQQHGIGLTGNEDVLDLLGLGQQSDRSRRDAGRADGLGERHLVTGAERDLLVRVETS